MYQTPFSAVPQNQQVQYQQQQYPQGQLSSPAPPMAQGQGMVSAPPHVQALMDDVRAGNVPSVNQWEFVGQVYPTQKMPTGTAVMENKMTGKSALRVNMQIVRQWTDKTGQPRTNIKRIVTIFNGQLAQSMANVLHPGVVVWARGEGDVRNWKSQDGTWNKTMQVVVNQFGKESNCVVLGELPLVQPQPQPQTQVQQFAGQSPFNAANAPFPPQPVQNTNPPQGMVAPYSGTQPVNQGGYGQQGFAPPQPQAPNYPPQQYNSLGGGMPQPPNMNNQSGSSYNGPF